MPPSGDDIVLHWSPGARQPGARQRPLRHSRPEQQPSLLVHASRFCEHAQVPAPVVCPIGRWQRAPPQQSLSLEQVSSRRRQMHRPPVQSIAPQQSRATVHTAFWPRQQKVPLIVDGFVATAAAAVAQAVNPDSIAHCIFGHVSAEHTHARVLEAMGVKPLLNLDMRLGEGSGAALAMVLAKTALHLHKNMATFGSAGVSDKG
jgi:hypothetical protein